MVIPRMTFRGMRRSEGLEDVIVRRFQRLTTFAPDIVGGEVVVEFASRHHRFGNRVRVRVEVTLPGEDVVVDHDASPRAMARGAGSTSARKELEPDPEHRFAKVAIREAFDVTRRRVQDQVRRRRGQ